MAGYQVAMAGVVKTEPITPADWLATIATASLAILGSFVNESPHDRELLLACILQAGRDEVQHLNSR
jgi:hypothetical protein